MSQEKKCIEELLREFTPRPAPPELRRRILAAASEPKELGRFLSPAQKSAALALGFLILASLAGDAWFARRSELGLRTLLAGTGSAGTSARMIDQDLIREISGQDRNLERWILERMTAKDKLSRAHRPAMADGSDAHREVDDVL